LLTYIDVVYSGSIAVLVRSLLMVASLCMLMACSAPSPKTTSAPRQPTVKPPSTQTQLELTEEGKLQFRQPSAPPQEADTEVDMASLVEEQAPTPLDAQAGKRFEAALAAMRAGRDGEAETLLQDMTRDFPALSGPHVNLGILYYRAQKYAQARAAFIQALTVNADSAISFNYLGILSRIEGDFNKALEYYTNALAVNHNYANAHLNLGILLELYMGQLQAALDHYKRYYSLSGEKDEQVYGWIVDLERRLNRK
jgi:tetratricopeptide (TPR) repeat protein